MAASPFLTVKQRKHHLPSAGASATRQCGVWATAGWRKGEFLGCCPNLGAQGVTEHFSAATWGRSCVYCQSLFLRRTGLLASTVWSPEKVFLTVISSLWNARWYGHIDDLIGKHSGFVWAFFLPAVCDRIQDAAQKHYLWKCHVGEGKVTSYVFIQTFVNCNIWLCRL